MKSTANRRRCRAPLLPFKACVHLAAMGRLMTLLFVAATSAAACGGKVDDSRSPSTPGADATSNAPLAFGCAGSCDRFRECTSAFEDRDACVLSCQQEFPDSARARVYASCIQATSCEDLERGLSMNYGPIGECSFRAHRP